MLTPDEEALLKVGLQTALQPFTDAINNIVGPTSERIGVIMRDLLSDQLRNAARVWGRAAEMLKKAGLPIKPVPLKVLKTILDGASVEENELLQDMWSAMLANASKDGEDETPIYSSFSQILRQLSPRDVRLLRSLYSKFQLPDAPDHSLWRVDEFDALFNEANPGTQRDDFFLSVNNLDRLGLVDVGDAMVAYMHSTTPMSSFGDAQIRLTPIGRRFVEACEAPKEK